MCTVTLIPTLQNNFILTSNRDETMSRKTLPPDFYQIKDTRMLFPKDNVAGGTWIGMSDYNRMICLLNGGFELHKRIPPYLKSRGVVVTDLLGAKDFLKTVKNYNFKGIEPFTIIAADWQSDLALYELVWDGNDKHLKTLKRKTYIWSSSTLYTPRMKQARQEWFGKFKENNMIDAESILNFHKNAGIGDKNVDLLIDRGILKTRSITQVVKNEEELSMQYEDLQHQQIVTVQYEALAASVNIP